MQQLSGMDASFVYFETPSTPMHVAGVSIYDPSTAPDGTVTFKGILASFQERLHLARTFRQKMVQVPMNLDHPYWVEDKDFDLEFHVRHIALPHPGIGGSCASRWPGCTRGCSTSAVRCGRPTSSRASTTSMVCRRAASPS